MATKSTIASGKMWLDPTAWSDGIVPATGDSVTISHDIGYNETGSIVLAAITFNARVTASTAAGLYRLKTSASVVNFGASGQLCVGSALTPYPINCEFQVEFTNATQHSFNVGTNANALQLYCAIPTYTYAKTTALVANGSTVIPLDTNLTTDANWRVGDPIEIVNVGAKSQNMAEYIISAIGTSSITVTVATSGFTGGLAAGSYIVLGRRNVRIIGSGKTNSNQRGITGSPTAIGNVGRAEWRNFYYVFNLVYIDIDHAFLTNSIQCLTATLPKAIQNVTFSGNNYVGSNCVNIQFKNCLIIANSLVMGDTTELSLIDCLIIGNSTIARYILGVNANGCIIKGNGTCIRFCADTGIIQCIIENNGFIFSAARRYLVNSCIISGNTADVYSYDSSSGISDITVSALPHTALANFPTSNYVRQINTVANTDVSTGRSGTRTKILVGLPAGYGEGFSYLYADAAQPMLWNDTVKVDDQMLHYAVALKQSVVLTTPLKVQLFALGNDPLLGGTADYEVSLTSGAVNTWEEQTIDAALPSGEYTLRVIFGHTTTGVTAWVAVRQEPVERPVLTQRVITVSKVSQAPIIVRRS